MLLSDLVPLLNLERQVLTAFLSGVKVLTEIMLVYMNKIFSYISSSTVKECELQSLCLFYTLTLFHPLYKHFSFIQRTKPLWRYSLPKHFVWQWTCEVTTLTNTPFFFLAILTLRIKCHRNIATSTNIWIVISLLFQEMSLYASFYFHRMQGQLLSWMAVLPLSWS